MEEKLPAAALMQPRRYVDFEPQWRWSWDEKNVDVETLIVELPGFKKQQLSILVKSSPRKLEIKGERHVEGNQWSRFAKDFHVPKPLVVDAKQIQARFDDDNGLLCVALPKLQQASKLASPGRRRREQDGRAKLKVKAGLSIRYRLKKAWQMLCEALCVRVDVIGDSFKRVVSFDKSFSQRVLGSVKS